MNLYTAYKTMRADKYMYYFGTPRIDVDHFTKEHAYQFIRGKYEVGAKDKIFDIGFHMQFEDQGKHEHTVALYLLGCYFKGMISDVLEDHIGNYIENMTWYDFIYTWYLTCLYHDTASVIERTEYYRNCPTDLDFYLGKHDIINNIYEHIWEKKNNKPYTYSEHLVKNYFAYRAENGHSLDHGIIAGYIMYDRLIKNYNDAWGYYKQNLQGESYECFHYRDLLWRIEHLGHFAYVANAIIAHNIWYSENTLGSKSTYEQYGLDSLIYSDSKKISIETDPLVFFLGLLDTIEPIKFFISNSDVKTIWEAIEIENAGKVITIKTDGSLLHTDKWFEKIKGMTGWLNVNIQEIQPDREVCITIL